MIQVDVLPIAWVEKVQHIKADIRASRNKTFSVEGVVVLQVEISGYVTTAVFGIVSKLATEMILGTVIIDTNVIWTEVNIQNVVPNGVHGRTIVESCEQEVAIH